MTKPKSKVFWSDVAVNDTGDGFGIQLDGRSVNTPAKTILAVPTRALAKAIAAEWQAQTSNVDPETMPLTRSANAAIDKVTLQFAAVAKMIAEYGDSDLICYRAEHPEKLVARQSAAWDPLIEWAAETFGTTLRPVVGIMHESQDLHSLRKLADRVNEMSVWQLTALHDLVGISGSLIIGLAAANSWEPAEILWARAQVDEKWQIDAWGEDEEAMAAAVKKRQAFLDAHRFFRLSALGN